MIKVGIFDSNETLDRAELDSVDIGLMINDNIEITLLKGDHCGTLGRNITTNELPLMLKKRATSKRISDENPDAWWAKSGAPAACGIEVKDGDRI